MCLGFMCLGCMCLGCMCLGFIYLQFKSLGFKCPGAQAQNSWAQNSWAQNSWAQNSWAPELMGLTRGPETRGPGNPHSGDHLPRGCRAPGILRRCMDPAASPQVQWDRAGGKPREPTIAPPSKAPTAGSIRRAPPQALIPQGTAGGNPIRLAMPLIPN